MKVMSQVKEMHYKEEAALTVNYNVSNHNNVQQAV